MVVDAHIHLWDKIDGRVGDERILPLENGKVRFGDREVLMMPPGFTDCRCTDERAIAYFDDAGVDAAVVVQEYLDGNQNAYLAEVGARCPDRFFMHALLDFFDPAGCLGEWERSVRPAGFRGVKIPAARLVTANRVFLDDPGLMALYEAMEASGCILAVDLAEGAAQVPEMESVAKTFPGLPIVLGHFAMVNRPGWLDQLRLGRLPNVYVESGGICWLFRDEGIDFSHAQEAIRVAANEIGSEKIMWGSDLPRTMVDFTYRQLLDFVRDGCRFFTADQKDAFLGGNAARVYGLRTDAPTRKPLPLITE